MIVPTELSASPASAVSDGLPVVVIAGRPNVGKSTLFNRLAGRRVALVADTPGVTRDRREAEAVLRGRAVRLMDTAGLEEAASETLAGRMRLLSQSAMQTATLVLLVLDARAGITPADSHFAAWLRRQGVPVLLVANKAEGRIATSEALEAYRLGLGDPVVVSAEHGEGIAELMFEIAERVGAGVAEGAGDAPVRPLKLAIVGRPNAGKSSLMNRLLGEERMLTGPEPGLTRDAIAARLTDDAGREVELVDTAGLRKRARIEAPLDKLSASASIEALKMAELVALVVDATEGLHEQDLQLGRLIEREGRACVLVLNKWDAVADRSAALRAAADRLETSLAQMKGLAVVTLSALSGQGVDRFLPAVWAAHEAWNRRVSTGELNRWFEDMMERHPPPLVEGRRLKLRYMTQVKARPPTFIVFGTRAEQLPEAYRRYLVNGLRKQFDLPGTPIRLQTRGTKNPFAEPHG